MKESPIKTERKTLHLPEDTVQALNKLAAKNGTDFSKEVRRAIDEYLDLETTAENIDMINGVIRQELSGQLKALGNRLAGLINRLTIISAAGYYANIAIIADLIDQDRYSSFEKIESAARKRALAFANQKNADALRTFMDDEEMQKAIHAVQGGSRVILIYKQRHRHPNYKKTPKGNYAHIGYIATRPGAVKNEGMRHGLFGKLEPGAVKEFDTWQEAARLVRELSYRRVNMYRGIISFSPETAAELGLSDHKAWEDYIDRHILTLAKFNGIRVQDLQWVAAHHNEKGHPHIHVVFWNKHQRTMVPFVHPSIPDKIRKQLIRDTFAERIKEYCEAKQRAKEHLSAITDEMIDEFEKYMEHLHPQEYRRLREAFGRITDDELGTSPLDSVVGAMKIAPFISRLFALKEKMPKKGRLYYKLLPEDVKAELDAFVAFLKENNEYIRNLVQDYAESKTRLAMLYDTDPAHIKEQQEKAVAEADKLIANKILDVIRTMLCKDREVQSFEYTEARKAYFTEQMICEILMALEQTAMSFDMEYDDRQKAMSTDLSKAARKEWYLRHKDKGLEP